MSDSGEVEVAQVNTSVLPRDVVSEAGSVKLFNKWSYEGVDATRDMSLRFVEENSRNR